MTTQELLIKAKAAKSKLGSIKAADIDRALLMMADQLIENTDAILAANALDVEAAKGNISDVMIDRLMLSAERISGMAQGRGAPLSLRQSLKAPRTPRRTCHRARVGRLGRGRDHL